MIIKICVDCGAVILSNNVTARRCAICESRFIERTREKYKKPPVDPLTADVRKADLNDERAKLTKEKRIAAETENRVRKAELLEVGDVEKAYSAMMMNFRSRILALPQKLAPAVVALEGDEQQVQDLIQAELEEALETLSHAEEALAEPEDGANEEAEEKDTG